VWGYHFHEENQACSYKYRAYTSWPDLSQSHLLGILEFTSTVNFLGIPMLTLPQSKLPSHLTSYGGTFPAVRQLSVSNVTKTLVRPQLEYASSVWDNPVKRNDGKVEAVQRSEARRFTCCDFKRKLTSSVTAMLQTLQWDSFQQRRARSRVLMLYRIHNGFVAIPASAYLQPSTAHIRGSVTRYRQIQCNTND